VLFSGEAISVKLPGTSGSFEALSNHAPLLSSLEKGSIVVRTDDGEETFEVSGGIVEVLNNKVVVLA
jgi:F-type H+-transporting ATPase subunit epsilon